MKRSFKFAPVLLALSLLAGASPALAVSEPPPPPEETTQAPKYVRKEKDVLVSCEVKYTVPPSKTVKSINIQQVTHYQFGYDERGYLWHRVLWDGAYASHGVSGTPAKNLVGLWADVYVESVTGSQGVRGLWKTFVNMQLFNTSYTFGPPKDSVLSRWEPTHRTIRVRNRNVISVTGGQFLAPYRMNPDVYGNKYGEPNYGMCATNTWSPYVD